MLKNFTKILLILVMCSALTACGSSNKFTLEMFNKIQTGMTYTQTTEILKDKGTLSAESIMPEIPGVSEKMVLRSYMWQNEDGSNLILSFKNDVLDIKAQAGLK